MCMLRDSAIHVLEWHIWSSEFHISNADAGMNDLGKLDSEKTGVG